MPLEQSQTMTQVTATVQPPPQANLTAINTMAQHQGEDKEMTDDASTAMRHIMNTMRAEKGINQIPAKTKNWQTKQYSTHGKW